MKTLTLLMALLMLNGCAVGTRTCFIALDHDICIEANTKTKL